MTRFWAKVQKTETCWLWTGATFRHGDGAFAVGSKIDGSKRAAHAHKFLWESIHGPVPPGLELDHLCRTPRCVRPDHLEPVTHAENIRRGGWAEASGPSLINRGKTHCPRGHVYDFFWKGERGCQTCRNDQSKTYRARKKQRQTLKPA